jgi:hypothetical protein
LEVLDLQNHKFYYANSKFLQLILTTLDIDIAFCSKGCGEDVPVPGDKTFPNWSPPE